MSCTTFSWHGTTETHTQRYASRTCSSGVRGSVFSLPGKVYEVGAAHSRQLIHGCTQGPGRLDVLAVVLDLLDQGDLLRLRDFESFGQ